MYKRTIFLVIAIMIPVVLSIGIISKIFAQPDDKNNSIGLSKQSILEAQGNVTDLTANKTGFKGESTVGLSGRSIEEANK
jgi:hypothetical protein